MTTTLTPPATTAPPAQAELAALRQRVRSGIWIESLGAVAMLLVAFALPSLLTDRTLRLEWIYRAVLLATFVLVVVRALRARLLAPLRQTLDDEEMALAVERSSPGVKQALISSLQFARELQSDSRSIESVALKQALVADVRSRLASIPFAGAIDAARVRRFGAGLLGAVLFFASWLAIDSGSLGLWALRNLALANVDWPRYTTLRLGEGTQSTIRLPQGDALTVRVTASGPVPDQAFVDYAFRGGEKGTEPMSRTGDREFTWTIDAVLADMQLVIEGGDALPLHIAVTIVERPRIDELAVTVTFPDYMEREPFVVPATEGELRLPKGALLAIAGKSQKPLQQAFALFGNDLKTMLPCAADGHSFAGTFVPSASGLLVIDVVDRDALGAGTPPKLVLRVGDDKPPTIDFRLRGIGSSITAHARIPGDLRVKDDFGLREVSASWRAFEDRPPEKGGAPLPEPAFAPAQVVYGDTMAKSALRYEVTAAVDLRQWNKVDKEDDPSNLIRPGMLFSLRLHAKDNFGPGEPHEGIGETMAFRVITRERMVDELRRRQVEQRQELQRVLDDEHRMLLELQEMVNPAQAGEKRKLVEAKLKALARGQQALGRRAAFIGESYQRILWEYENNRLIEPAKVRQLESLIPQPLQAVAKEAFPATARLVDTFTGTAEEATRTAALEGYRDIERRLQAVLKEMEQAENLAALIQELKTVINLERQAIDDVERRKRQGEQDLFKPKTPPPPPAERK